MGAWTVGVSECPGPALPAAAPAIRALCTAPARVDRNAMQIA